MSDKDFSDDEGWREAKSKNRKHSSTLTTPRPRNISLSIPPANTELKKIINKIGNISTWICYIIDGNIVNLIKEKLSSLNENVCGGILNLWDCLFYQLKSLMDITNEYENGAQLKNSIYASLNDGNRSNNQDHEALTAFSIKYKIKVKFTSIDKNSTEIIYDQNFLTTIYILHIGLDLFLPLEASDIRKEYIPNKDDEMKINMAIRYDKNANSNPKPPQDNNRLNELRKLLKGLEKVQPPVPINKSQTKLEYDVYTPGEKETMDDLILCELRIIGAHYGIAIPIKTQSVKFEEIKLLNRRNCGYNAFDGDIVRVKINDPVIPTGKVIDVYESYHKPINSIYVCKVNRDQGSLMTPLDRTFPKIHVDNQPGHRMYESKNLNRKKSYLKDEQKSVVERERESVKYADNLYYSLYDVSVNEKKLDFNLKSVVKFDPHTCDDYFIVFYERWDPIYLYPFGRIVGILRGQDTFEENFELISSICNIESVNLTTQYEKEVQEIIGKVKFLEKSENYIPSDAFVFTIDSKNTKDIDDAISYHKEGEDIVIGIHISDVTKYISSTHEIYYQAQTRFCTIYPPSKKPIHLLDERLSTDALSLIPNVPRAVVSVFFYFSSNVLNNIKISDIKFSEGVIVSKYQLSFEEVSKWLKQNEVPEKVDSNLLEALKKSFEISKKLRQARLPKSYFVRSTNKFVKDLVVENQYDVEMMVSEFMLLANEHVARKVYDKYPDFTLLRIQNPVRNYENWLENLLQSTNLKFEGELNFYCSLLGVKNPDFPVKNNLLVSRKFYDKFISLIKNDPESAKNLLLYDKYYNEFVVHIIDWYKINSPARYECSKINSVNNKHFMLNKDLYTNFTSPIRRFSDIVVHRLLKSVINDKMIDDSSLDIHHVCSIANQKYKSNDRFEEICASYTVFEDNKTFCFILDCACSEINNDGIVVAHHLLQKSLSLKTMKFSCLTLSDLPFFNEGKINNCTLKWRRIIYSCSSSNIENNTEPTGTFVIDKDLYNVSLSSEGYKDFGAIRRSCSQGPILKEKLQKFKSKFTFSKYKTLISSDLYSIFNPIIDIQLHVFIKSTMRIQFCKNKVNGLPKITPELYIVTPTFQICLIHHDDPVRFFVQGGKLELKHNDIKTRFTSIVEYKNYFEPLIRAESIEETLSEDISFSLLSVKIKWILKFYSETGKKVRYGVIMLPEQFCQDKNIYFSDEKPDIINRYEHLIDEELSSIGSDLLCLRFKCDCWSNYWTGHGEVVHASKFQQENTIYKIIIFLLTHSDFDTFSTIQDKDTYSVDVYIKPVVTRRQQLLMKSLDRDGLVNDIIMGENLEIDITCCDTFVTEKMFYFNESQKKAMMNAFKHKFSLIWGPPGTGKTLIGCCLSFEYFQRKLSKDDVVLYCGPSNDCVDLVAHYLKKKFIEICPRLLRIYSNQQELADFPLPGFFVRTCLPLSDEMKPFSLHFLIRKEGNFVDSLKEFDEKFRAILHFKKCNPEEKFHDLIQNYRKLLITAKRDYISKNKCDIVLCTTSVSATKIMKSFNITQVIVDEAGMCKEPETLIPISKTESSIKNIVLIGDHKQLRPIILSRLAGSHGLQISLFERYQHLRSDVVTMLNFQYRMHPSICEFPSREFYSSKLKTQASSLWSGLTADDLNVHLDYYNNEWNGLDCDSSNLSVFKYDELRRKSNYHAIKDEKWPHRKDKPYICFDRKFSWYPERTIFINVIGTETVQSVTNSTGNENSRGNKTEVEVCGYIYRRLIENDAPVKSITILTQYKLQQHLLKLKCQDILKSKKIISDPIVKTVIRSQGSENDYIIFSTVRSLANKNDINTHPTPGWERQYLGFITDPNQINVALTRAKKGLIIVGNKQLLQVNQTWKNVINNYRERNCIVENYLNFI